MASQNSRRRTVWSVNVRAAPANRWLLITDSPYEYDIGREVIGLSAALRVRYDAIEAAFACKFSRDSRTSLGLPVEPDVFRSNASDSWIAIIFLLRLSPTYSGPSARV